MYFQNRVSAMTRNTGFHRSRIVVNVRKRKLKDKNHIFPLILQLTFLNTHLTKSDVNAKTHPLVTLFEATSNYFQIVKK